MSQPKYFLSRHTFLCPTEFHWIVLDLKRDRYLSIHRPHFEQLGPQINGWCNTYSVAPNDDIEMTSDALALAADLVKQDLLTTRPGAGKPCKPTGVQAPKDAFDPRRADGACAWCVPALTFAASRADYLLRATPIEDIVHQVARRRQRSQRNLRLFDWQRATRLTGLFNRLRPWYPRDYLCLYDALALLEFLALFSLFPSWVFGVTSDPFHAHCWVQQEAVLLNDSVERASIYVPILNV